MAGRRKVWITRAEPGAAATAERVRALGFEPVVAPLLTLSPLPDVALLPGLFGVLLHSPKAASALARLIRRHPAPQLKAWCLSKAVVRPLLKSDLAEVVSASAPNEDALLALLR